MRKISVVTLGCKVNQYDTAALLNHLPSSEFVKNEKFDEPADVYVIDTCTVTHKADSEARNYVYRAKRSNSPRCRNSHGLLCPGLPRTALGHG